MQPGWYADPATPGLLRWWDGYAWGVQTAPDPTFFTATAQFQPHVPPSGPAAPAPPPPFPAYAGPPPNAGADLAQERTYGRRASIAVAAAGLCYPIVFVLQALELSKLMSDLRDWWHALLDTPSGATPPDPSMYLDSSQSFSLALNVFQIGALVVGVLFLMWFHRAAVIAGRLGYPARRSSAWAVLGFIIPIVSLWFPYQVARDLTPPGHPARKTATLWWTCFLGMQLSTIPVMIAAWFSTTAAVCVALGSGVLAVLAALAARRLIAEVNAAHAAALGR